jgi:hypothetical protein
VFRPEQLGTYCYECDSKSSGRSFVISASASASDIAIAIAIASDG